MLVDILVCCKLTYYLIISFIIDTDESRFRLPVSIINKLNLNHEARSMGNVIKLRGAYNLAPSKSPPVGETLNHSFLKASLPGRVGWG